jgi:hypothetical protein
MRRLLKPLWIALAVAFLLEAWLWDRGRVMVTAVLSRIPWRRLRAGAKDLIAPLPPEGVLAIFAIPVLLVLPLKVTVVWLVLKGDWGGAVVVFALAKLFGLSLTAFAFDICRDKLLELSACRRVYDGILAARRWAREMVDPMVDPVVRRMRARLRALERRGTLRLFRFIVRLRSKMRRSEPSSRVA